MKVMFFVVLIAFNFLNSAYSQINLYEFKENYFINVFFHPYGIVLFIFKKKILFLDYTNGSSYDLVLKTKGSYFNYLYDSSIASNGFFHE